MEYALFAKKSDDVKFSSNRHRVSTGVKVTPHQSVAILVAADFGLLGNNSDKTLGIPQNNPWEALVGIAFTANTRDLFKTIGRMRGQVTDAETGLPLPDVEVTLVGEVTLPRVTDLSGTYEMPNMDVKAYQVRFIKEGYKDETLNTRILGGETTVLDVSLKRPGPRVGGIQASIVDGTSGAPIPRAFARISGVEAPLAADENGVLKAGEIVVGQKTLRIEAPGYLPAEFPIEVFENEIINQNFTLQKEPSKIGSFAGKVTNEEGVGLTAVFSSADEKVSPFGTNPVNGSFTQPLAAGEYELKVVAENYLPETVKFTVTADQSTPMDVVLKKPEKAVVVDNRIILPDAIFFDFNSPKVQKKSLEILDQIVEILKSNDTGYKILRVEGHTDDVGSNAYNESLSQKRAQSVRKYLISKGVNAERVEAVGNGEVKPIATNLTDVGRSENRRVEFHLVREGDQ
jgi:outer membrane protein OmpA-like peptidoglycan-associated protein